MKAKRVYIPATVSTLRDNYEQVLNYLGHTSVYLGKENPKVFSAPKEEVYKEIISLVSSCDCYLKISSETPMCDIDTNYIRMENSAFLLLDKKTYAETKLGDDVLTKAVLDNQERMEIETLIRNVAEINEKKDGHDIRVIETCSRLIKDLIVFKRGGISKMTVTNKCYYALSEIAGYLMLQDSLDEDEIRSHIRRTCEQIIHNDKRKEAMPDIWS